MERCTEEYKRRDLRCRADLQLVGHVSRPLIIDVNCYRIRVDLYGSVWKCTALCGSVRSSMTVLILAYLYGSVFLCAILCKSVPI